MNSPDRATQDRAHRPKTSKKVLFYMLLPVLLLAASLGGWAIMVSIAVDDPGFAVERDYYEKGANYDDVVAQRRENARLGWQMDVLRFERKGSHAILEITLQDEAGRSVEATRLTAVAFPVARANARQTIQFEPMGGGRYRGRVLAPRAGLWEVRVTALGEGARFTAELRPELGALARPRRLDTERKGAGT